MEVNAINVNAGNDTAFCNNPILLSANANGLATCPETSSRMVPGEKISVEIFDWAEIG